MASGNEHVNMDLVFWVEGPDTAIASQKGPQQCRILRGGLQIPEQRAYVLTVRPFLRRFGRNGAKPRIHL